MAWPAVLESVFISLAGMIDTLMVSELGPYAVAAVGLTTQPKFIGIAFFLTANIAVSALVARRRGQNKQREANEIFVTALAYTLVMCVLVSVISVVFAEDMMRLCGSNADTHEAASLYFKIIMGGTFFNVLSMVINAAQRGSGNTRVAMTTNVTSSIVNIVFNYLLITGKHGFPALGIIGAAGATVFGTVVASILSVISLFRRTSYLRVRYILEEKILPTWFSFKQMIRLTLNFLLENLLMRIGFLTTALYAAKLGTDTFAAHQVGMNVLNLGFSFGDGMQVAAVALIGRSLGEGQKEKARTYGSLCQNIGFLISLCLSAVLFFGGREIYSLFFKETHIIEIGVTICAWMIVILIFQVSQIIYSGCLRGAGDARYVLFVALISVSIIRTAVTWLGFDILHLGLNAVWAGVLADQLSRFILNCIRFSKGRWTEIRI